VDLTQLLKSNKTVKACSMQFGGSLWRWNYECHTSKNSMYLYGERGVMFCVLLYRRDMKSWRQISENWIMSN